MAYVPPALRRKQQAATLENVPKDLTQARELTTTDLPSLDDIQKHFWPTLSESKQPLISDGKDVGTSTRPESADTVTTNEDHTEPGTDSNTSRKSHSTLNATEAEPDRLRYVLLFRDAHPRWNEDNIIYVKTDIHLLPQDTVVKSTHEVSDGSLGGEIMIFEQHCDYASQVASRARFCFLGFYHLEMMQILEPKSPQLVRMLEQKWTRTNKWGKSRQIPRESAAWQKSLSYRWAVLKFKKVEESVSRTPPKIEISHSNDPASGKENVPSLSVNEMLRGLRLKDQAKASDGFKGKEDERVSGENLC